MAGLYIASFLGSFSYGYLILRYSIPDIRKVETEAKMGLSFIVGIVLFAFCTLASIFINQVLLICLFPMLAFVSCALIKLKQLLKPAQAATIAYPQMKIEHLETPAPSTCAKCGAAVNAGDVYCGGCGTKQW